MVSVHFDLTTLGYLCPTDNINPEPNLDREKEFMDLMKLRFLSGQDKNFDYR